MKFTAVRTLSELVPEDAEEFARVPKGARVMVEYVQKRNYENHKRFFAFIKLTFDMQDHFDDADVYRRWLQMKAGYFQTVVTPKGETIFLPDSIKFEKMDETEFRRLFEKCITVFVRELGNGVTNDDLWEVLRFG